MVPGLWAVPRADWLTQVHETAEEGPLPLLRGGGGAQTTVDAGVRTELSRGLIAPAGRPCRGLA